jgi:hypothetical protein
MFARIFALAITALAFLAAPPILKAEPQSVLVYFDNTIDWTPGSWYSDNGFNNHNYLAVKDQWNWSGAQLVEAFGVHTNGSWCCSVVSFGNAYNYVPATYIKVFCWNRSNEPGGGNNVYMAGYCQRGT